MTIVNPLSSPVLVAQPSTNPVATPEERQVDLRLEQIVRATVVEGGLDRPLLELNHRRYRAQSDLELQAGQKLTLQVLQTHPRLEFRVLPEPLGGRLNQLLPLLARPYDWPQLVRLLQQQDPLQLTEANRQIFQQLQQLLQPAGPVPNGLGTEITRLVGQLQQLALPFTEAAGLDLQLPPSGRVADAAGQFAGTKPLDLSVTPLLLDLQQQLQQLPKGPAQALPQGWLEVTRNLLSSVPQQINQLQQLPPVQLQQLVTLLGQLQQQQQLPLQFAGELESLLARLNVVQQSAPSPSLVTLPAPSAQTQPQGTLLGGVLEQQPAVSVAPGRAPLSPSPVTVPAQSSGSPQPQVTLLGGVLEQQPVVSVSPGQAALSPSPATVLPAPLGQSQVALLGGVTDQQQALSAGTSRAAVLPSTASSSPVVIKELSAGLEQLLQQVKQLQPEKGGLPPELGGRLEVLLDKLQQLPHPVTAGTELLPGLDMLTSQLTQIVQQGVMRPEGGPLGFLSQLFGFHLETELLNGKKKAALTSLKLSLLDLRERLGKGGDEPLQRLEILQLCKAKLAEQQVQFLPLLFPELEEGYLFVEKQREQKDEQDSKAPLQLSISLRVSALGNMRIDMLYDAQGLHLRVACEDKEKMRYLQGCSAELTAAIETVPLQGISFAADAQMPTRKLQERLLPETLGMLDARI